MRKAARLLKRGAITEFDYALVAADIITRLDQGRPIASDDRLHIATFGAHGMIALDEVVKDWEVKSKCYGPLAHVPNTLGERFQVYEGSGDYLNKEKWEFVWGDQCADLLWRAKKRLGLSGRLLERLDRWKARQEAFAPSIYGDIWKGVLALLGMVVTYFLGRLRIP